MIQDFGADSAAVLERLKLIPESAALSAHQDHERLQAACVLTAQGLVQRFDASVALLNCDWRDALVAANLAGEDWAQQLDAELGESNSLQ